LLALKNNLESILVVQFILETVIREYEKARSSSGPLLGCHIFNGKCKSNENNYVGFIKTQKAPLRLLLLLRLPI